MDWRADFIEAKYHLTVAKRMMRGYIEYPEKRFLIGVINESSKSASSLIRAFLIYEQMNIVGNKFLVKNNKKELGLEDFFKIASKYLEITTYENLMKIFEIKKARKISTIELAKVEKIILLIEGKYRVLTVTRINEFIDSIRDGIIAFPGNVRQV